MNVAKILIVEDDDSLRRVMQVQLENLGHKAAVAPDVPRALEILSREQHDIVICDLHLPGQSGMDLLRTIRVEYPDTVTIIVTGYGSVQGAVDAMKAGAYDYLTKPVHPYELKAQVERIVQNQRLIEQVHSLRRQIDQKFGFEKIIGQSPALMHVLESAARVAQTSATVMIFGETGTGKELLAKAIHAASPRSRELFVTVNCGAIPRELLESELFGHIKGAFTGAVTHKKGKIETAHGGTVFLDEIGEMPIDLQVRVLRLIQEHEIEKVGASTSLHIDVRIIAATHRNLEAMVQNGTFREDLYYRLVVVPIEIPPLRARPQDIPELVCEFFDQSTRKYSRNTLKFSQELLPYFSEYHWPGNVRQLQNAVERMVVLCQGDEITPADLPEFLRHSASSVTASLAIPEGMTLDAIEKQALLQAMLKCNWNQTHAARQLGITRKILTARLAKHGMVKSRRQQLVEEPCEAPSFKVARQS